MELNKEFEIKFGGLAEGLHVFDFDIEETFFEPFVGESDYGTVEGSVKIELEKMSTMMVTQCYIRADWITDCDRCGQELIQSVSSENKFFIKFGDESETNEDVLVLPNGEYKFNVSPFVYEFLITALPSRKIHPEKECDSEVLKRLEKFAPKDSSNDDNPMWDELKKLS